MPLSSITDRRLVIQPGEVHNVLSRHMLADGYEIVMDLRKSKGSWVFDAKRGRAVLDFFTNFASCPIGYNHPRLDTPEFREFVTAEGRFVVPAERGECGRVVIPRGDPRFRIGVRVGGGLQLRQRGGEFCGFGGE